MALLPLSNHRLLTAWPFAAIKGSPTPACTNHSQLSKMAAPIVAIIFILAFLALNAISLAAYKIYSHCMNSEVEERMEKHKGAFDLLKKARITSEEWLKRVGPGYDFSEDDKYEVYEMKDVAAASENEDVDEE